MLTQRAVVQVGRMQEHPSWCHDEYIRMNKPNQTFIMEIAIYHRNPMRILQNTFIL